MRLKELVFLTWEGIQNAVRLGHSVGGWAIYLPIPFCPLLKAGLGALGSCWEQEVSSKNHRSWHYVWEQY